MPEQSESLASLLDLSGKTAVVTGGAMGIGKSVATHLARAGAAVVLADQDASAADITAKELVDQGLEALPVRTDVALEDSVGAMMARTVEWKGGIDILVNNAGISPPCR